MGDGPTRLRGRMSGRRRYRTRSPQELREAMRAMRTAMWRDTCAFGGAFAFGVAGLAAGAGIVGALVMAVGAGIGGAVIGGVSALVVNNVARHFKDPKPEKSIGDDTFNRALGAADSALSPAFAPGATSYSTSFNGAGPSHDALAQETAPASSAPAAVATPPPGRK